MGRFRTEFSKSAKFFEEICFKLEKISKFEFHDFYKEMYGQQAL